MLLYIQRTLLLLWLAEALSGCRKHVSYEDNPLQKPEEGVHQEQPADFPRKRDEIRTPEIFIQHLEEFRTGGQTGVSIYMSHQDQKPDYYRYYICQHNGGNCQPSPQSPGEFAFSGHRHYNAPAGLVTVFVSGCLRPKNESSRLPLCSPFVSQQISLSPSTEDPKLSQILTRLDQLMQEGRKDCLDFFEKSSLYYNKLKVQPEIFSESAFIRAVREQMDAGQDLSCQLIYSSAYDELLRKAEEHSAETQKPTEQGGLTSQKQSQWTPKNIFLVMLGSVGVLAGGAVVLKSLFLTENAAAVSPQQEAKILQNSEELSRELTEDKTTSALTETQQQQIRQLEMLYFSQSEKVASFRKRLSDIVDEIHKQLRTAKSASGKQGQ